MAIPALRKDRVRMLIFVKRKDGLSFEEWSKYWLETHGPIFTSTEVAKQNIMRYEQLHVNQVAKQRLEAAGFKVPDFDGVVVLEAESYDKIVATVTADEWHQKVIPDGDKIFKQESNRYGYYAIATLHEKTKPKTPPAPRFAEGKAQFLVQMKRKEGLSQDEFENYWLEEHSKIITGFAPAKEGLTKYEQLHINREPIAGVDIEKLRPEWDGVALFEAESVDNISAVLTSEGYRALADPAQAKFLDRMNSGFLPVDVAVLLDRDV
ncbi:hypothetical protein VNI00_004476 [Paramarasmius palmivorus]|uniref:EthD domain-containing protein n=1 Tax=Paramarasmius palmivorus TaxID=297713 RepID=A0AAW0DI04_9AGAR